MLVKFWDWITWWLWRRWRIYIPTYPLYIPLEEEENNDLIWQYTTQEGFVSPCSMEASMSDKMGFIMIPNVK